MDTWSETEELCIHLHNEHCVMTVKFIMGELGINVDVWRDVHDDAADTLVGTFSATWEDFLDFLADRKELNEEGL